MLTLKYPPYPSPYWFTGDQLKKGILLKDGSVFIAETSEHLKITEGKLPSVGTTLILSPGRRDIQAEPEDTYLERIEQQKREQNGRIMAEKARNIERSLRLMRRAAEVNASLLIPVPWTSGFKSVLSGLSENSWGDGRSLRTVIHVLLLGDVREGRFVRNSGNFLCTAPGGSDGMQWVSPATHRTGEHGNFVSEITCKQCLKIASRWKDTNGAVSPTLL